MLREEVRHLRGWQDHHRHLIARLTIVAGLTLLVDLAVSVLVFLAERDAAKTEITSYGDALFFTTVQLLTISSQLKNPLTFWGRLIDVALEIWGVLVVAGSAGAFAVFLQDADRPR
jgi:hypothetical protein